MLAPSFGHHYRSTQPWSTVSPLTGTPDKTPYRKHQNETKLRISSPQPSDPWGDYPISINAAHSDQSEFERELSPCLVQHSKNALRKNFDSLSGRIYPSNAGRLLPRVLRL